jgi:eukaryotic-like serine/threonine-protein kinase
MSISKLSNLKPLATGGQKEVYLATHDDFGQVAYKIIKSNTNIFERTKREIRAVSLLNHPNIPKIYEHNCEQENTDLFIIEEFIDGKTLRQVISLGKRFVISEIVNFLDVMLDIAVLAESKSLVHRDIKPDNIILDDDNKIWLLDFGIARHLDLESLTQTEEPFGLFTLGYASSEQFRNFKKEIDIRADLFSIGVVVHEMVTGLNFYRKGTDDPLMILKRLEKLSLPPIRIEGDIQFQLSTFIKMIGDYRRTRRPRNAKEALDIYNSVKTTLRNI